MTTPTNIVRVNQPHTFQQQQQQHQTMQNQGQFVPQTIWTHNLSQTSQQQQQHQQHFTLQKQTPPNSVLQYATVKNGKRDDIISFSFE